MSEFNYTQEETKAFIQRGVALAQKFNTVIALEPKDTITMGIVITACGELFASRAIDAAHAEKMGRDLASSVTALFNMRQVAK